MRHSMDATGTPFVSIAADGFGMTVKVTGIRFKEVSK